MTTMTIDSTPQHHVPFNVAPLSDDVPSMDEMIRRTEWLLPRLKERSAAAIEARRIPDETIADMQALGIFRILQPFDQKGAIP